MAIGFYEVALHAAIWAGGDDAVAEIFGDFGGLFAGDDGGGDELCLIVGEPPNAAVGLYEPGGKQAFMARMKNVHVEQRNAVVSKHK